MNDYHIDDMLVLSHTTNNVIRLTIGESFRYFRVCRVHTSLREYTNTLLKEFCENEKLGDEFRKLVLIALKDNNNFKCFTNMGIENDISSNIASFLRTRDANYIGLGDIATSENISQIYSLAKYVWGELFSYCLNEGLKYGQYQTFNSSRSIATNLVAKMIGLDYIIPDVQYAYCSIKNCKIFGTIMNSADGVSPYSNKITGFAPKFQRDMMNLQILDILCYEKDHRPGNYLVSLDKNGMATSLSAFDNDSPMTFFPDYHINFSTYMKCSVITDKNGYIFRPYMDRVVAKKILSIEEKKLVKLLNIELSHLQIMALIARLRKLQVAIRRTIKNRKVFLLNDDEWNDQTIVEELSGKYGMTYLCLLKKEVDNFTCKNKG